MTPEAIAQAYTFAAPLLHERHRRLFAAMLARAYGLGGISVVATATRLARSTIERGVTELETLGAAADLGDYVRRPGGGKKPATVQDPGLEAALRRLVDPVTRGDPESPLPSRNRCVWAAMNSNCAFRSGCWRPSLVLRFACRLNSHAWSSRRTVSAVA